MILISAASGFDQVALYPKTLAAINLDGEAGVCDKLVGDCEISNKSPSN